MAKYRKAQIVNTLTILIAIGIVMGGLFLVVENPKISGLVTSSKVSQDVIDKINMEGSADVIVFLTDDGQNLKFNAEKRKDIAKKQNSVLASINYKDKKNNGKHQDKSKPLDMEIKYTYSIMNAFSGNLTSEGLTKLQNNPDVEKIVLVRKVGSLLSTSVPLIQANKVWGQKINNINLTGAGQSICIIDTGVDYHHASLGNCTLASVTQHTCKVIAGYDFVNNDADPIDDNDHGTHVAGIAAGNGTIFGVAKGASIVAIKALDFNGDGDDADVIAAVDWCVNNATRFNISVISMSLGDATIHTSANCPTTMDSSMQNAVLSNITVFAASGNQGSTSGINYPACSPYAIAVGASDNSDSMASLTNTYSLLDVVAPGVNIVSAKRAGTTVSQSGTSMATPHAAGVAALIYQKERLLNNRPASQDEVLSLLKKSNVSISDSGLSFKRVHAVLAVSNILNINSASNSASGNQIKLNFKAATNLENISEAFTFAHNFISLNSSRYSAYNKSANVTFYNLTFNKNPVIFRNGVVCSDCRLLSYSAGRLIFNVSHFTNYTSAANAQLEIFDQRDTKGGSRTSKSNQQTYFYANYTNFTSKLPVLSASCSINVSDSDSVMTYNSSSKLYEYNRSFFTSNTYRYNVSCNQASFERLNLSDNIFISPLCLNQTPNADITINAGQSINCTGENIILINQSITVKGNLIINNTYLTLAVTGPSVDSINITKSGNLTLINSTLNASVNTLTMYALNYSRIIVTNSFITPGVGIDIQNNSTVIFTNSRIYSTAINSRGNSTVYFIKSNLSAPLSANANLRGASTVIFNKTKVNNTVVTFNNVKLTVTNSRIIRNLSFEDSSTSMISNSTIRISTLGDLIDTPLVNFTRKRSNVTHISRILAKSRVYGYVDMPVRASTYTSINVKRYYPIQVNYTDGSPVPNKLVNITNATNHVQVWAGYTNANGFVNANINFTTTNRLTNYTVKVNPSQNTSLLGDTPLLFTLSDNAPPEVSLIRPNISNEDSYINYNATATDDVNINECRLYIDNINNGSMSVGVLGVNIVNRSVKVNTPGIYQFLANCTDTSNNYNDTSVTSVRILDITPPYFNQTLTSQTSRVGSSFHYKVNASDNVALSNYGINDTTRFKINKSTGLLQNNTFLSIGTYKINISINDTSNKKNYTIISVMVVDLTPPYFNQTPTNKVLELGTSFRYKINASDNVALSNYRVNDTTRFTINKLSGLLQNSTVLSLGVYKLNITINDTSNNRNSSVITITVQDSTPPIISNINHSGITNQSAKINWTTNENSNTTVNYGLTKSLGTKTQIDDSVTFHTRLLSGLTNFTLYFYNVSSCSSGGCAENGTFNFTTKQNTVSEGGSGGNNGGGGGSSTVIPICETTWYCDLWSTCVGGTQSRLCQDIYGCVANKVENQSCTVKETPKKEEPITRSGILESKKEDPKTTGSAILESPNSGIFGQSYMIIMWLIVGLFLLLLIARRVDTFSWVIWEEERRLNKNQVEKAELLFDKLIKRYGKSKERERKYTSQVEKIAIDLEKAEIEAKKAVKKEEPVQIPFKNNIYKEEPKSIYKETEHLSYDESLKRYKGAFEQYLSAPVDDRKRLGPELEALKKSLLDSIKSGKGGSD